MSKNCHIISRFILLYLYRCISLLKYILELLLAKKEKISNDLGPKLTNTNHSFILYCQFEDIFILFIKDYIVLYTPFQILLVSYYDK